MLNRGWKRVELLPSSQTPLPPKAFKSVPGLIKHCQKSTKDKFYSSAVELFQACYRLKHCQPFQTVSSRLVFNRIGLFFLAVHVYRSGCPPCVEHHFRTCLLAWEARVLEPRSTCDPLPAHTSTLHNIWIQSINKISRIRKG